MVPELYFTRKLVKKQNSDFPYWIISLIILSVKTNLRKVAGEVYMNEGQFSDFVLRGGMKEASRKLLKGGRMTVAFIGGSVTVGAGASDVNITSYRALTYRYLERSFPQVDFHFVNAAIGGTDSTYGAFRLKDHVFKHGPIDLLFVEFAVNDSGNREESIRAMEGIVRQAKRINPHIDICFLYLANKSGSDQFSSTGRMQDNIYNHEEVAEHYRIPSVHIAGEIYRRIESEELRWDEMSGDEVHPSDFGYSLYGRFLQDFLGEAIQKHPSDLVVNSPVLPPQMDIFCYENADLLSPHSVERVSGWRMEKNWTTEQTCNWTPPADIFIGEEPGASFQIRFTGTAAGFSMLAGMDIGDVDVSIDGGAYRTVSLFDRYCTMFYRPKIVLFADDLTPGLHTFDIRISEEKHEQSTGHAIRIQKLLVN